MTSIGFKAFSNCNSLTSLTIGKSVTSIGYQAFEGCSEITNVRFVCENVDNWFSGYKKIKEIVFGNNVKEIGANAFYGCNGLTSVKIGNGVRKIGEKAFALCPELTDVYCYRDNPPNASNNTFEGSDVEHATLYVPEPSIHFYDYYQPWIWFGNKKALEIESNIYKLTYMIDGAAYKTYEKEEGEIITPEPTPAKEGYTFSGWSEIPGIMPAHDVTVNGSFIRLVLVGDANCDGIISEEDIVEVANSIMGTPSSFFDEKNADANADGVVNAADIVRIANIINGAELYCPPSVP